MRIGVYDVDSRIPNLALMKVAAWYRAEGHTVEMYKPLWLDSYDKIYASTVFNFSDKSGIIPERMEVGGTGSGIKSNLPDKMEDLVPDYSIYEYPHSIGFTMRGCRFRCTFCVVPEKEGRPYSTNTIDEIWTNRGSDFVMLLDNDFFGNPDWRARVKELRDFHLKVNFSQGLNIRIITDEQARALASVRFSNVHQTKRQVYFAWDRFKDGALVAAGIDRCVDAGIPPRQMGFYVLIGFDSSPEQDLFRVQWLKDKGCDPFAMPYDRADPYQQRFCRWVNRRAIFQSVSWDDYRAEVRTRITPGAGQAFLPGMEI